MKKILFVEDDALVARIYGQNLASGGFDVVTAEDGLIAMKRMQESQPDLVVLDLMMPKMSGLDVIRFMRGHPAFKSTPVIVLSNSFINKLGEEVARLGVEEMLAKAAITPALLIETIGKVLANPSTVAPHPPPPAAPAKSDASAEPPKSPPSSAPSPARGPARAAASGARTPASAFENESAAGFRKRIRRDFFEQIPGIAKGVQQSCKEFLEAADSPQRALRLEALSRKIGFVTHMTGMAACYRIAQLASALEALLFELQEKPAFITETSRQTIASTVALLTEWLSHADQPDDQCLSPTTVLVVDDDAVSNRALVFALSRVNLLAKSVTDPFQALEKLRQNPFDAVLLDINLPGMSGIKLCEQMRKLPQHKNTPVIFFTSHVEFEPAARSVAGIGDDFITKPIIPIELTVKITAHVLKRRLAQQNQGTVGGPA